MTAVTRALALELVALLRSDQQLRNELRHALDLVDDELLTVAAAAKTASVTASTISRHIRSGSLPATGRHKSTRIKRGDLFAFLQRGGRREVPLSPEQLADREEGFES